MEDYSDFDELYQAILSSVGIQPESASKENIEHKSFPTLTSPQLEEKQEKRTAMRGD